MDIVSAGFALAQAIINVVSTSFGLAQAIVTGSAG